MLCAMNIRRDFTPHRFSVRSEVQYPNPEPIEAEEGYDDDCAEGDYNAPVVVKPRKTKRLPGVALLKKLHKMRLAEKDDLVKNMAKLKIK